MLQADYRLEGRDALIAVTIDGRVVGFAVGGSRETAKEAAAAVVQEDVTAKLRLLQQKKKVWAAASALCGCGKWIVSYVAQRERESVCVCVCE